MRNLHVNELLNKDQEYRETTSKAASNIDSYCTCPVLTIFCDMHIDH